MGGRGFRGRSPRRIGLRSAVAWERIESRGVPCDNDPGTTQPRRAGGFRVSSGEGAAATREEMEPTTANG
jgi:hypothetical protein